MSDAIFIRRCLEFVLGVEISQVHFTDSSSARQLCNRQRRWKDETLVRKGTLGSISGAKWLQLRWCRCQQPTTLATYRHQKPWEGKDFFALMSELGMVSAENGQPIGQEELEALRESHTNSRDVTKLAKTIFRLATVLGLGPTGSAAQGQCESHNVNSNDNETLWIWLSIFLLAVAWIGFAVACYKLWSKMDQRMQHNELQQAEQILSQDIKEI